VRVYLPGSGWVEFDPTNGIVGNHGLIRVAVARDIYQAVPISGTWRGFPGSFTDMNVSVNITVDENVSEAHSRSNAPQAKGPIGGNRSSL
jgi:transglutaminase-like putative cysteine protease